MYVSMYMDGFQLDQVAYCLYASLTQGQVGIPQSKILQLLSGFNASVAAMEIMILCLKANIFLMKKSFPINLDVTCVM